MNEKPFFDRTPSELFPTVEEIRPADGLRFNNGKPRVDLVPTSAIIAMSDVLTFGAQKYAENNWRKGMKHSICYASAMRHLLKYWSGEDKDSESGLPHLYHVLTNIAFLIEYQTSCPEKDDRFEKNK